MLHSVLLFILWMYVYVNNELELELAFLGLQVQGRTPKERITSYSHGDMGETCTHIRSQSTMEEVADFVETCIILLKDLLGAVRQHAHSVCLIIGKSFASHTQDHPCIILQPYNLMTMGFRTYLSFFLSVFIILYWSSPMASVVGCPLMLIMGPDTCQSKSILPFLYGLLVNGLLHPEWNRPLSYSTTQHMILGLHPACERRRYFVTTSLIGWG